MYRHCVLAVVSSQYATGTSPGHDGDEPKHGWHANVSPGHAHLQTLKALLSSSLFGFGGIAAGAADIDALYAKCGAGLGVGVAVARVWGWG